MKIRILVIVKAFQGVIGKMALHLKIRELKILPNQIIILENVFIVHLAIRNTI